MAKLKRTYKKDRTTGVLTLPDGDELHTLELPWHDNRVNVSCIPEGRYKFTRDGHGRFQWFKLLDVPGRSFIEFHQGIKPEHSQGCILMSRESLLKMRKWYGNTSTYILEIKS